MNEKLNNIEYVSATDKIEEALQTMFKLSTGALALSITFKSGLVSETTTHLWALATSWVFLSMVVFAYVSNQLIDVNLKSTVQNYCKNNPDELEILQNASSLNDYPSAMVRCLVPKLICVVTLLSSFMLGVLFLLIFALKNLNN